VIAGRYTLEREIGRGGMGAVWLGRDEVLNRVVALKRIGMMPGGGSPDLERAEREARLAARLNHPHVVAVFDLVTEGDQQWLVMEYVEGVTLSGLIDRDGALTPDEASPLVGQAADALAAAHAAGIVHRDVKPSNILVSPQGRVKLSDFGIARAEADASLTQTGLVTGSPAYLAPEVASGQPATDASDVWSIGATLFHALSGRPPYDVGGNLMGALYRIVHEEPPRLVNAGWLSPLLESTMTRDPKDRWSMAQVRDYLGTGPASTVVRPAPTGAADSRTRVMSRGVPPVDPVPTRTEPPPPTDPPTDPPPVLAPEPPRPAAPRKRRGAVLPALVAVAAALVIGLLAWAVLSTGDGSADQASDQPSGTPTQGSTSRSPTESATSASPSESATSASPSPSSRPTAAGMERFIEDYLATVTEDPRAAFAMLTPEFQAASGGFRGYRSFWSTIESAEPLSISADPETLTVNYRVHYTRTDGSELEDEVSLQLVFQDGRYLIAGES
jgi:serine/threonine protein kinase